MTTIIGIQNLDEANLYADVLTTSDGRAFDAPSMKKIIVRGDYVLAAAGAGGICDHITHVWRPPTYKGIPVYEFAVSQVVPSLMNSLNSSNLLTGDKDDIAWQVLAAVDGEIFQIESDGTVLQSSDGLYGIGTGSPYALGALATGATESEAMQVAARFDMNTRLPMQVVRQVRS